MSKRFGRNQRRKLRAELTAAQADADLQRTVGELSRAGFQRDRMLFQQQLAEARAFSTYVRSVVMDLGLGPYTVLLPPSMQMRAALDYPLRAPRPEMMRGPSRAMMEGYAPESDRYFVESLYQLRTDVTRNYAEMASHMHLYVEGEGRFKGYWSYAVSDRAFLQRGITHEGKKELALNLARQLLAVVDQPRERPRKPELRRPREISNRWD